MYPNRIFLHDDFNQRFVILVIGYKIKPVGVDQQNPKSLLLSDIVQITFLNPLEVFVLYFLFISSSSVVDVFLKSADIKIEIDQQIRFWQHIFDD